MKAKICPRCKQEIPQAMTKLGHKYLGTTVKFEGLRAATWCNFCVLLQMELEKEAAEKEDALGKLLGI